MTTAINRLQPQFITVEDALAHASERHIEILVTLTAEAAATWKVRTKRGRCDSAPGGLYRVQRMTHGGPKGDAQYLPRADQIERIDYLDLVSRETNAPLYVRGGE